MNKVIPLILISAMTLLIGAVAYAMPPEYVAMRQDVLAMDSSMQQLEQAVKALQDPAQCQEALKAMDSQMSSMRRHMKQMHNYAEMNGHMTMSASLGRLDKAMTTTMQGMGLCLRDKGKAVPMIEDGVKRMRTALDEIRAGI